MNDSADTVLLEKICTDGFAVVPNLVNRADTDNMRTLLEIAVQDDIETWQDNPNYADHWMVHNLMLKGEPFVRLLENRKIHSYLSQLLSPHCILYAYTSSSLPPGGSNFSKRVHVDAPLVIPGYWTNVGVIIALDDFTEENGATYFLPGSFKRESPPSEEEFFSGAQRVYPKAGDGVIFNARTWHYGGENRTNRPRHAATMNVCRHYMRQRFDYPRMMTDQVENLLSSLGKRFLGYDVRIPTSLDEYYVAPSQRLYKPGQY